ncbi:MAG: major facilitator superfamily 1 [Firmicutes bacterium]|nr:major facilitator superfamily 1 [Bacillota bacterium]
MIHGWGKLNREKSVDNKIQQESRARKSLFSACLAHVTHDGISDTLYVLFPIWQAQFGLSFVEVGFLKTLFSGSMASFQVPTGFLAQRIGEIRLLLVGTILTSISVMAFGWVSTPFFLAVFLIAGGLGESVQHPLSSSMISSAYTETQARRTALSTFNVAGDIGKLILPGITAFIISQFNWQIATKLLALFGLSATFIIYLLTRSIRVTTKTSTKKFSSSLLGLKGYGAFWSLSAIGIIDSATRMGFLTFFPFLLRDKGANIATIGLALTLVFAGGAIGKFVCGVLATRLGILRSVIITEVVTALCIGGMLTLSLENALILTPILGVALNGTSSVLYGSVPELVSEEKRNQAFALFYTATIGAGAISPPVYGLLSDIVGTQIAVVIIALVVLVAIPLTIPLRGKLVQQVFSD